MIGSVVRGSQSHVDECNVNLWKLLSAHKSHVRETSLFTGTIPNQVCNSKASRFVLVPGQKMERSSRGNSMGLRLQSVMMADVSWHRIRIGIVQLEEFGLQSWVECSRGECYGVSKWVRRMSKLMKVFCEYIQKSWWTEERVVKNLIFLWTSYRDDNNYNKDHINIV